MKTITHPAALEQAIRDVAGSEVLPIVKALRTTKVLTETALAKQVRQEVNQTRTMLYKLHQANLVSFVRKKDPKNGWFVYHWSLVPGALRQLIAQRRDDQETALQERISHERSTNFFRCSPGCTRAALEQAIEMEFRCPECGELMGTDHNGRTIIELEAELSQVRKGVARHR